MVTAVRGGPGEEPARPSPGLRTPGPRPATSDPSPGGTLTVNTGSLLCTGTGGHSPTMVAISLLENTNEEAEGEEV